MDMKYIIDKISSDENIETPDLSQLEEALDSELAKTEPDFDLVDELTKTILELRNVPERRLDITEEIASVKRRGIKGKKHKKASIFSWVAVAVCFLLVGGVLSVPDAVGENISRCLTKKGKNFVVDLNYSRLKDKKEFDRNRDNDPYGIKAFAEAYGMEVCAPTCEMEGEYYLHVSDFSVCYGHNHLRANYRWDYPDSRTTYLCIDYCEISCDNIESLKKEYEDYFVSQETIIINGIDAYVFYFELFDGFPYYELVFYDEESPDSGIFTQVTCGGKSYDEAMKIFKSIC